MENIDIRKVNKFLQLTNQEDLTFVSYYLYEKKLRREILRDCHYYMKMRDYNKEYSFQDYVEVLYVECLMSCDFEYPILYEEFVHAVVWSSSHFLLVDFRNADEFIDIQKHISNKREEVRKKKNDLLVRKFICDVFAGLYRD